MAGSLGLLFVVCSVTGCSGISQDIVVGTHFRHITAQATGRHEATGPLHIYISGDGRPFLSRTEVAADPSPSSPYVLKLMQQDQQPHMLLGRPCYHGLNGDRGCTPREWTTHRYSAHVVDSMVAAAKKQSQGRSLVLIGYSGGGTLAMLMAPHMNDVVGIITIAANLDVAAWTNHHGYSALTGSLNPALALERTNTIPQVHYFGAEDEIIPGSMVSRITRTLPGGTVHVINGHGHACCWHKNWSVLLEQALESMSLLSAKMPQAILSPRG